MKILIGILIVVAIIVVMILLQRQNRSTPQLNARHSKSDDAANRPLLKQFGGLTSSDFSQHPVWVNVHVIDYGKGWYDGTDEETFRPWDGNMPVDPSETMFLVKAKLTLADGTEFNGFITPQHEGGAPELSTIQPHLFTDSGELIPFWFGSFQPAQKDINGIYEKLGKNSRQLFPIQFRAEDGLAKGIVTGEIPGFCRLGKNDELIVEIE